MPDQFYYLNSSNDPVGPMSLDEIRKLSEAGIAPPSVQVRQAEENEWQSITEFATDSRTQKKPPPAEPAGALDLHPPPNKTAAKPAPWENFISLIQGDVPLMTPRYFQGILTFSIVTGVLSLVAAFIYRNSLPPMLLDYLDMQNEVPQSALEFGGFIIGVFVIIALIVSYTGLYMFRRWARSLFLILHVPTFLVTIFLGPVIETGPGSALADIAVLLGGAILALAYYSPISSKFS